MKPVTLGSSIGIARVEDAERAAIHGMGLLTLKPVLYAFNVDEVDFTLGRADAEARIRNEIWPQLQLLQSSLSSSSSSS